MTEFVKVGRLEDLPEGGRLWADLTEESVIVFNVGGQLYCIADLCTHDGGPLEDGELIECTVECPRHGARFDIRTGKAVRLPATEPIPTYPVKIENGDIYVEAPQPW